MRDGRNLSAGDLNLRNQAINFAQIIFRPQNKTQQSIEPAGSFRLCRLRGRDLNLRKVREVRRTPSANLQRPMKLGARYHRGYKIVANRRSAWKIVRLVAGDGLEPPTPGL